MGCYIPHILGFASISNDRLEVITKVVLMHYMDVILKKGELEWACILTVTKRDSTLHVKETKKLLSDI